MLLSDISYYSSFSDTDLSVEYGKKCIEAANKTGDSLLIAEGYNTLAIALIARSDYRGALENNEKALRIRLRHGDPYSLLSSYSKMGNCLYELGKNDDALSYYLKSLKIAEDEGLTRHIGLINNNIAQIFMDQKDHKKARKYYLSSIEIAQTSEDTLGLTKAVINLGISYMREGEFEPADSLFQTAFSLIEGKDFLDVEAGLLINFGVLYKDWGKPEKSIPYYKKAMNIYLKTGEAHGLSIVYSNLGNSFLEHGVYDSALAYYKKGIELAKATNSLTRLKFAYESISNYYRITRDYRTAFAYDSLSDALRDSVFNIENSRIIEELNTQYETEKKEKQLAEQKAALAEQELKVQRQNVQLTAAAGGIFILFLAATFIYRNQKNKQEKLRQQVALERAESINKIQDEKLRISRDLHDNIGSQLTFVVSALDNLNYVPDEAKRKEKLSQLGDFTKDTISQLRETIWALKSENITVEQLASKLAEFIAQAKTTYPEINFAIEKTPSDKELNANQAVNVYRTLQEALHNAIKYSNAKNISLRCSESELTVEDDGIGFDRGTVTEGNGLSNMEARMKEVGFKAVISSKEGSGTKVSVLLS